MMENCPGAAGGQPLEVLSPQLERAFLQWAESGRRKIESLSDPGKSGLNVYEREEEGGGQRPE